MKKATIVFLSALLLPLIFLLSSKVLAKVQLPRIATACEDKSGLLFAVDDGFSLRKKCQGNSRRVVIIGEQGQQGEKGDPGLQGPPGSQGPQGEPGVNLSKDSFYVREFAPYFVNQNEAMTVIYGCDNNDVAIGGGLYNSSGSIANWRTVRDSPNALQENQHNWVTTVINVAESGQFSLMVKCLKM